jgi:hypothetical protein
MIPRNLAAEQMEIALRQSREQAAEMARQRDEALSQNRLLQAELTEARAEVSSHQIERVELASQRDEMLSQSRQLQAELTEALAEVRSQQAGEGILDEGSLDERAPLFGVAFRVDTTDPSRPRVHLVYMIERQRFEYRVDLQTTRPHLGGFRWWFLCPLCQGRAQKLFLPPDADRFGCRQCHKLSYASRSEKPFDRYIERARKIQLRLGGSASLLDPFPAKPKGMWSRTICGSCINQQPTIQLCCASCWRYARP